MPCTGSFVSSNHVAVKNVPAVGPVSAVSVTVCWTIIGGCTFAGGKVSIYLLQGGQPRYCGSATLGATSANQLTASVSLNVPANNRPTTGNHDVSCYVTGTMSDGTAFPAWCDPAFPTTVHCPNPVGND
jgi:hypothetical protein